LDVVGFGALNVDRIYYVDTIPGKDEESFVKRIEVHAGGSAANTITAIARLGLKSGIIGKIGKDSDGDFILSELLKEGVNVSGVIRSEGKSGNALILVDESGNRAIIVDPGVNDEIRPEEINLAYVSEFKMIHLTSFVSRKSQESFKIQKRIVKELEIKISFDPGMIYSKKGFNEIREILKRTEIFMPNAAELRLLTEKDYRDGASEAIDAGVKVVVVKLGERGCYITDGDREVEVPAFPVKPADTTGAGDAFNAGFIYGYLKGMELEKCGRLGNFVAAHCIQYSGARKGLPGIKEIGEEI